MSAHYLTALLSPHSVAIIGATEREGALGRFVIENMRAAAFNGAMYAVNPKHSAVFGTPCFASIAKLPHAPELIVVTTPAETVAEILRDAGKAGVGAAVVLSAGFAEIGAEGRERAKELVAVTKQYGIRMIGPNCVGIMRPAIGLNATFANAPAKVGSLALVSQSGAVCTAILDWAATTEVGFSSVISLGGALDVDFGEALHFLVDDPQTRSILLYVEGIRDARGFVSALRAAARVKPVIVLKAGRHAAGSKAVASHTGALTGNDAVFDAVLARCGVVRVKSSLQLFAAARLLADPHLARALRGDRLAILTNGGGPGVVAADCATDNGISLATLSDATTKSLNTLLPAHWSHANPVDLIGDAPAARFGAALDVIANDADIDAALVLFCPQKASTPEDAAQATIDAAKRALDVHSTPVFTAWLGGASIGRARAMFEAAGIPNFITPENAVEAFSYLAKFRQHQAQLLESVPAAESMTRVDCEHAVTAAQKIRAKVVAENRTLLNEDEAKALLHAFGVNVALGEIATTRDHAQDAAQRIGYPVVMKIRSPDISHKSDVGGVRLNLVNARQVASAFDEMLEHVLHLQPTAKIDGVSIQPMLKFADAREVLIGVSRDPVFGPVIAFGSGGIAVEAIHDLALALPPLNSMLANELIRATRISRVLASYRTVPEIDRAALVTVLLRVSAITCSLPWISEMDLNPVLSHPKGAAVLDARIVIDAAAPIADSRYRHMAIFPYPVELEHDVKLNDGAVLHVRAVRPDDADRERTFVAGMSDASRYSRFLHSVNALSDEMIARFTQLDYDREMALIALAPATADEDEDEEMAGVARYYPNSDRTSAEFAIAIGDAWQGRGLGNALMRALITSARAAGYANMSSTVLEQNGAMLKLAAGLGFVIQPNEIEADTATICLKLIL